MCVTSILLSKYHFPYHVVKAKRWSRSLSLSLSLWIIGSSLGLCFSAIWFFHHLFSQHKCDVWRGVGTVSLLVTKKKKEEKLIFHFILPLVYSSSVFVFVFFFFFLFLNVTSNIHLVWISGQKQIFLHGLTDPIHSFSFLTASFPRPHTPPLLPILCSLSVGWNLFIHSCKQFLREKQD